MDIIFIAETNFVIDIALEQSKECKQLLTFAQGHGITLVIPEYAFAEAEGTIVAIIHNRLSSIDTAINALKQSARSTYYSLGEIIDQLHQYKENTKQIAPMLYLKMRNLQENASIIPLISEPVLKAELRELRRIAPFKKADRNIYESILSFANANRDQEMKMLFLTRDKNDFDFSYIREELASVNVELFFSAGECIRRIREIINID